MNENRACVKRGSMKLSDLHKYNQHQESCCVRHEMVSIPVLLRRLMKGIKENIFDGETTVEKEFKTYQYNKITYKGTVVTLLYIF